MDTTKRKITKIAREVGKFTFRTLHKDGIGTGEGDILHMIRKNPGITQKEICLSLALDKGSLAREISRMEKKGYLTRKENPSDGRSQLLYATEKADALKNSKSHIESLFYSWLLEDFTESEKETFSSLLERIYLKCKAESRNDFKRVAAVVKEGMENEE